MSARDGSSSSANTYHDSRPICHHCPCILQVSGTDKNPGRKFYCCRYWKDSNAKCKFFVWVDEYKPKVWKESEDELKNKLIEMDESCRVARMEAERRKKAKNLLLEELISTKEDHARMETELRNLRNMFAVLDSRIKM
ncbi:unnamed protein product [Linum trigynum]|uniref:GRF-type domain-containing protein n=1 Tax=Linum trigynum TaxID=586398 RepID=A0AAV2CUC1_9ROSI